jgi:hypothetical protein
MPMMRSKNHTQRRGLEVELFHHPKPKRGSSSEFLIICIVSYFIVRKVIDEPAVVEGQDQELKHSCEDDEEHFDEVTEKDDDNTDIISDDGSNVEDEVGSETSGYCEDAEEAVADAKEEDSMKIDEKKKLNKLPLVFCLHPQFNFS